MPVGLGLGLQKVVPDKPFLAFPRCKELGDAKVKQPPAVVPACGACAVGLGEQEANCVGVQALEPDVRGLAIVTARDGLLLADLQIAIKDPKQVEGGHLASCEEVPRNPVGGIFVVIDKGPILMDENMDEDLTTGLEPAGEAGKQFLVIAHMLQRFNGNDAVKF